MRAWLAGTEMARAGRELPPDLPSEGDGYWIRRGYHDHIDR